MVQKLNPAAASGNCIAHIAAPHPAAPSSAATARRAPSANLAQQARDRKRPIPVALRSRAPSPAASRGKGLRSSSSPSGEQRAFNRRLQLHRADARIDAEQIAIRLPATPRAGITEGREVGAKGCACSASNSWTVGCRSLKAFLQRPSHVRAVARSSLPQPASTTAAQSTHRQAPETRQRIRRSRAIHRGHSRDHKRPRGERHPSPQMHPL